MFSQNPYSDLLQAHLMKIKYAVSTTSKKKYKKLQNKLIKVSGFFPSIFYCHLDSTEFISNSNCDTYSFKYNIFRKLSKIINFSNFPKVFFFITA